MGKTTVDILQIKKYLDGELDAKAMHRLERQALDDPFLADALEGYQKAGADQRANLADLRSRLKERTEKQEARVVPLIRYVAAAASILVIVSAGIWWYNKDNSKPAAPATKQIAFNTEKQSPKADSTPASQPAVKPEQLTVQPKNKTTKETKVSQHSQPPATVIPAASESLAKVKDQTPAQDKQADKETSSLHEVIIAKSGSADQKVSPAPADTTPLNEMIATGYTSSKKSPDTTSALKKSRVLKSIRADSVPQQRLAAQAPGVRVYPDIEQHANLNEAIEAGKIASIPSNQTHTNRLILGKVINLDDGSPVKGASVQVMGTSQVARTDSHGFFSVNADTIKGGLLVTNNGYKAKKVTANTKDSLKTIVLQPDSSDDLGEDIATGFTSQTKNTDNLYYFAHPIKGWSTYRDYLKTNAVSPDGATGAVRVAFTVDKYGTISNIKIVKGLTDAANKKAMSLVKDGPDWIGNSNKKPEKLTLRIKFSK